jgi:K+-transporting ATPase ATPase C chain
MRHCVPVHNTPAQAAVTAPTPGQHYAKQFEGGHECDLETVPEPAIAFRPEIELATHSKALTEAVTESDSGPDISIADLQASTVARETGSSLATVIDMIRNSTTGRSLGLLGDPGVYALTLDIALDSLQK